MRQGLASPCWSSYSRTAIGYNTQRVTGDTTWTVTGITDGLKEQQLWHQAVQGHAPPKELFTDAT